MRLMSDGRGIQFGSALQDALLVFPRRAHFRLRTPGDPPDRHPQFLQSPQPGKDSRGLPDATAQMAEGRDTAE